MDDPLVPESLKGNAKYCVYGGVGTALAFVIISIIMTVVYGAKQSRPAWFVLALGMLGFLIATCWMLNWLRHNTVEEKIKYIVTAQLVFLVLISIAALIDILRKETTCDPCVQVPSACHVAMVNALAGSVCATGYNAQCGVITSATTCFEAAMWSSPYNGSLNIVYLNTPPAELDVPTTTLSLDVFPATPTATEAPLVDPLAEPMMAPAEEAAEAALNGEDEQLKAAPLTPVRGHIRNPRLTVKEGLTA